MGSQVPYFAPEWLELEKKLGFRPCLKGSLEEILESGKNQLHHTPPVNSPGAPVQFRKSEKNTVQAFTRFIVKLCFDDSMFADIAPVLDDEQISPNLKVRVYTPKNRSSSSPLPLGVFGHGGGFCGGDLNSDDTTARYAAEHVPCIIVSIDYRLGPEHKFPTMLDDFEEGFNWAYDHAAELGGDSSRVFAWGCSAGGTLSCSLARRLVEKGQKGKLRGIMNLAGGTLHPDNVPERLKGQYKSIYENAVGVPIVDRHVMDVFNDAINADPNDIDYTPALATNLADFPPTYSVACGLDPMRDDAVIMDSELKKAGVRTKIDNYPGLPHIFWVFDGLPSAKIFQENMLKGIDFVLNGH